MKNYQKLLVVNPTTDPESDHYIKMMANFGDIRELVIDYFKNNTFPNERLELMRNKRKLSSGTLKQAQTYVLKARNKQLEEIIKDKK